jgi:hypothetical protein
MFLKQLDQFMLQYYSFKAENIAKQQKCSLCTAVTLDEARERTSVSWMHKSFSGHVDSSQILDLYGIARGVVRQRIYSR